MSVFSRTIGMRTLINSSLANRFMLELIIIGENWSIFNFFNQTRKLRTILVQPGKYFHFMILRFFPISPKRLNRYPTKKKNSDYLLAKFLIQSLSLRVRVNYVSRSYAFSWTYNGLQKYYFHSKWLGFSYLALNFLETALNY